MRHWKLIIAAVAALICAAESRNITECFYRFGNTDITRMLNIKKVWRVTTDVLCLHECALEPRCHSVVYNQRQEICKLYNHFGKEGPGFLISAFKKVYYRLKNETCLEGVPVTNSLKPVKNFQVPAYTTVASVATEQSLLKQTTPVFAALDFKLQEAQQNRQENSLDADFSSAKSTEPTVVNKDSLGLRNTALSAQCDYYQDQIFLSFDNTLTAVPGTLPKTAIPNMTEEECTFACKANVNPATGETVSCWGYSFFEDRELSVKECIIHEDQLRPNGPARLLDNEGTRTAVKVCIPALNVKKDSCDGRIMLSSRTNTAPLAVRLEKGAVKSLGDCVRACISALEFQCKSAFYHDDKKKCFLLEETMQNGVAPPLPDEPAPYSYFENDCVVSGLGKNQAMSHDGTVSSNPVEEKSVYKDGKIPIKDFPQPDEKAAVFDINSADGLENFLRHGLVGSAKDAKAAFVSSSHNVSKSQVPIPKQQEDYFEQIRAKIQLNQKQETAQSSKPKRTSSGSSKQSFPLWEKPVEEDKNWLPWTAWSACVPYEDMGLVRIRFRMCKPGLECQGKTFEAIKCDEEGI